MATKKSTTKKSLVTKKAPAKRATPKKRSVRSRVSLRSHVGLRSEETDFMTFRVTKQTIYWLVLGAVVIMFTFWLMKLQADIQSLYDQIDTNTIETSLL